MQSFDIDVFPQKGSWVIRVGQRVMSGAPTRSRAERIARLSADSLCRAGADVRLTVYACPRTGDPEISLVFPAHLQTAA